MKTGLVIINVFFGFIVCFYVFTEVSDIHSSVDNKFYFSRTVGKISTFAKIN